MLITSTGCSLGDLRDIQPEDRPAPDRGLYVLQHPIQSCGRMVSFKANGYCFPAGACNVSWLQVHVFRRECDCTYANINSFFLSVEATHNITNNVRYKCSISESMNHLVTAGDVVGIRVLPRNSNRCSSFQPAIQSSNDTVLYSQRNYINELEIRQDVLLNIQVSIGKCCPALLSVMLTLLVLFRTNW